MISKPGCRWTPAVSAGALAALGRPAGVLLEGRDADGPEGAAFHDTNGVDFFNDGSGNGTCFARNGAAAASDTNPTISASDLYPARPTTPGVGTVTGNAAQLLRLAAVVLAKPPTDQERFWHVHPHPARPGRRPYEG